MPRVMQMKKEALATGLTVERKLAIAGKSEGFAMTRIHEPSNKATTTAISVSEVALGKSKTKIKVLSINTMKKSPVITTAKTFSSGFTLCRPAKPKTRAAIAEMINVGYMKTNLG